MRPVAAGLSIFVAGLVLSAASAAPCLAGGALYHDLAGAPVGWSTAGPVSYETDRGKLGLLTHASAVDFVGDAFGRWQGVATARISYERAGDLGVNVDETNFGGYLGPFGGVSTPLGTSPIVFDEDGEIFEALYGVGTSVLGFASPTFFSDGLATYPLGSDLPAGSRIIEGLAFLNGRFIDGVSGAGNPEIPLVEFEAVFVHEFGHFSGLGHTQIHGLLPSSYPVPGCCVGTTETMFPFLLDANQRSLGFDDIAALSVLYPRAAFLSSTGCIEGEVRSASGDPVPGANVVAENRAKPSQSASAVSGANLVDLARYRICGLTPGEAYTLRVEEIDVFHSGGSRVGPFSFPLPLPGPPEYYNGLRESSEASDDPHDFVVLRPGAGETVRPRDIELNRQPFSVENQEVDSSFGGPVDFATGDFDRDGKLDIVAVGPATGVTFRRNLGAGAFAPPTTLSPLELSNFGVAAGHFNADVDDYPDIAVANYVKGNVEVFWGDGTGGFSAPVPLLPPRAPAIYRTLFAQGRFNDDAYADLVLLLREPSDQSISVSTLLGSGSGSFTLRSSNISTATGFRFNGDSSIVAGQFLGTAADDLAVGEDFVGSQHLWLLRGNGAGAFDPLQATLLQSPEASSRFFSAGDLNGDGKLDLAMRSEDGVRILLGQGNRTFSQTVEFPVSNLGVFGLAFDDFNGDHILDVAVAGSHGARGDPGARVDLALGDGNGGIAGVHTVHGLAEFPSLSEPKAIEAADFTGDGHADLVVSNKPVSLASLAFPATLTILLERSLPECVGEDTVEITDTVFAEDRTFVACDRLTAGPGVEVPAGVVVRFLSGGLVSLENGFQVDSGATFTATAH